MIDMLYPLVNYHPYEPFIKSKYRDEIRFNHNRILSKVQHYYRNGLFYLRNDHPLMRCLTNINTVTEDGYRAYLLARDQSADISNAARWFNGLSDGRALKEPYFFGDENTPECVFAVEFEDTHELVLEQYMNPDKNYWMAWEPIRVRYHGYTDMDYTVLSYNAEQIERVSQFENTINIIDVDVALLYMQYWYWCRSQVSKVDDVLKSPTHFLMNFPLNNALGQQMEIAYFNRMVCLSTGQKILSSKRIPAYLGQLDTYKYIDDSINNVFKNYRKAGGMNFDKLISNLPSLDGMDYGVHFGIERLPMRRQAMTLVVGSVVPLYHLCLELIRSMQAQRWNSDTYAKLKKGFRQIQTSNILATNLKDISPRVKANLTILQSYLYK